MFSIQHGFFNQTLDCDKQGFEQVINDPHVRALIDLVRKYKAEGNDGEASFWKKKLPAFIFQATFKETVSANGNRGKWRKNAAAQLTGLCMIDVDHVDDPRAVFKSWPQHAFDETERFPIGLVYITPGGHGLKIVFEADPDAGNLIENQRMLAQRLGVDIDESCKDAARLSFVCKADDILYRNDNILFSNNHDKAIDFDVRYGEFYRNPTPAQRAESRTHRSVSALGNSKNVSDNSTKTNEVDTDVKQGLVSEAGSVCELKYGDTPLKTIIDEYLKREGIPVQGDRHRHLLQMASRLRYLVDNKAEVLKKAVREADYVREWESAEANTAEIDNICEDVCGQKLWYNRPKSIDAVLACLRISSSNASGEESPSSDVDESVYKEQWNRLQHCLAAPYDCCAEGLADNNKLGAVYAAGTMYCTLLTRCWYRHFDGMKTRLNPQTTIIGDPASGKSFAYRLDREIMAVMRAADEPGRKAEASYKEQRKEKADAKIKMPQPVIRYIPSRTSNAVFYRRALNAKEIIEGMPEFLHLYTFDSELDSSVTAQSGGSWIGKHDIELKAFHNEFSGVDYANADSVNENIQVFYNTVVTGTPISLSKKITMNNVNDGLCSRMAIFRMQSSDFKMIARGNYKRNHETDLKMKEWGYYFDRLKGEIPISRLVDYVFDLCAESAKEAELRNDKVLDYLRKRAVFYAIWFTIPRILARLRTENPDKPDTDVSHAEVRDDDLEFAHVIYDTIIYWQDRFFGQMLQGAWANGELNFKARNPARYQTKNQQNFEALEMVFSLEDVSRILSISTGAARTQISRWLDKGWIIRYGKKYKKV